MKAKVRRLWCTVIISFQVSIAPWRWEDSTCKHVLINSSSSQGLKDLWGRGIAAQGHSAMAGSPHRKLWISPENISTCPGRGTVSSFRDVRRQRGRSGIQKASKGHLALDVLCVLVHNYIRIKRVKVYPLEKHMSFRV